MTDTTPDSTTIWFITACMPAGGAIVATLGIGMLIGWFTGIPALFQIVPTLARCGTTKPSASCWRARASCPWRPAG